MTQSLLRSRDQRGVISLFLILVLVFGAIVGTFVLDLGSPSAEYRAPQVSFDFEWDGSGTVTITHNGGDMVRQSALDIQSPGTTGEWQPADSEGEITAGQSVDVTGLESGDTVRIVWESPDSDVTTVLGTYEVP